MNEFNTRVYEIVKKVPEGKVISYGQIAKMLGAPKAARRVGSAMRTCPDAENIPWQRVVMSDGSVTGGNFADMRRGILEDEGVVFLPDGKVDMKQCAVGDV